MAAEPPPLVVSEFEWLSLEYALVNGLDHPLDELLEDRNVIVERRAERRSEPCAGYRATVHLNRDAT